jgi:hypothetical protein
MKAEEAASADMESTPDGLSSMPRGRAAGLSDHSPLRGLVALDAVTVT